VSSIVFQFRVMLSLYKRIMQRQFSCQKKGFEKIVSIAHAHGGKSLTLVTMLLTFSQVLNCKLTVHVFSFCYVKAFNRHIPSTARLTTNTIFFYLLISSIFIFVTSLFLYFFPATITIHK
jgi:hypothetical protein